ncbi:MAG: hypothetical protein GX488_03485 [Clostridiales bacterium]|nr:hypothetical protein [Clostridiales bacterium]
MDKWDYIRLISGRGDKYGYSGGVGDLLEWCGKYRTADVTENEAKIFYESLKNIKKEGFSKKEKPKIKVISLIWEGDNLRD